MRPQAVPPTLLLTWALLAFASNCALGREGAAEGLHHQQEISCPVPKSASLGSLQRLSMPWGLRRRRRRLHPLRRVPLHLRPPRRLQPREVVCRRRIAVLVHGATVPWMHGAQGML